jgi:HEPN domain-containing protein
LRPVKKCSGGKRLSNVRIFNALGDRFAVLDYIKQSVERLRDLARANSDKLHSEMLALADQLAENAANLEAEMIEAGYIPARPAKPD